MKKMLKPREARKILSRVPLRSAFWLCTNDQLRSLRDVAERLDVVGEEVFRYHVNRDKNDFEVWIREVIQDKELAREIARIKTRHTLIRKIQERLEELHRAVGGSTKKVKRKTRKVKKVRKRKVKRTRKKAPKRKRSRTKKNVRKVSQKRKIRKVSRKRKTKKRKIRKTTKKRRKKQMRR